MARAYPLRTPSVSEEANTLVSVSAMNGINQIIQHAPMALIKKWIRATRLAVLLPTTAAKLAVSVVPMFSPSTMASALSSPISPETIAAKVNAVAAEDD